MKRSVFLLICAVLLLANQDTALAKVNEQELAQYLAGLDWTMTDLEEYLNFYGHSLDNFSSITTLQAFLGTPINDKNLTNLLKNYSMTAIELEELLAEFGESLADYRFIEELTLDIKFFQHYFEDFSLLTDFLSIFGVTEAELEKLFEHLSAFQESSLADKMHKLQQALAAFSHFQGEHNIPVDKQEQLLSLLTTTFASLEIDSKFYLAESELLTEMELSHLVANTNESNQAILLVLHDLSGKQLATLAFNEDMAIASLAYDLLEQLGSLIGLAQKYRYQLAMLKLPVTAGNFVSNLLLGVASVIFGLLLIRFTKRGAKL